MGTSDSELRCRYCHRDHSHHGPCCFCFIKTARHLPSSNLFLAGGAAVCGGVLTVCGLCLSYHAGLDYDCIEGLALHNSGNVPMQLSMPGTACDNRLLEPGMPAMCDTTLSATQAELEHGSAFVHVSVNGSDVFGGGTGATVYSGMAQVQLVQAPSATVAIQQHAGYFDAGKYSDGTCMSTDCCYQSLANCNVFPLKSHHTVLIGRQQILAACSLPAAQHSLLWRWVCCRFCCIHDCHRRQQRKHTAAPAHPDASRAGASRRHTVQLHHTSYCQARRGTAMATGRGYRCRA